MSKPDLRRAALLLIGLTSLGCQVSVPEDETRLQVYEVPAGLEEDVLVLLQETLDRPHSSVAGMPGGRLVVRATPAIHHGVAALVDSLADSRPVEPLPAIELTCWAVIGEPATAASTPPAPLDEIEQALASVTDAMGPQRFHLLERLQVRGQAGRGSRAQGSHLSLDQSSSLVGDRIVAQIEVAVSDSQSRVATEVSLRPDELVVLAQTGSPPRPARHSGAENGQLLLYVVRARLVDG